MADGSRAAAIADLRARLSRLGATPRVTPASAPPRRAVTTFEPPVTGELSLAEEPEMLAAVRGLGFDAELTAAGVAWVRRVSVDLAPFLERAAAPAPVSALQLLRLAHPGGDHVAPGFDADACAVVDIETLGLRGSGVVAFLVGIGVPRGARLDIDQLLLADMGAESALLHATLARLGSRRIVISYNGRTFDFPVLRSRCIVTRTGGECLETLLHCDLLAMVRRLFRDRLGACTLRQAELSLLGFERHDDVGGAEAPQRFSSWLRYGHGSLLEPVVRHNQLDLCATMVLAARLAAHVDGILVEPVHPSDRYRLAVHLERSGVADGVDDHYRSVIAGRAAPWDRASGLRLAKRLRRGDKRDHAEAIALLEALWGNDRTDLRAARALCILLERDRRPVDALAVAETALQSCHQIGGWRLERMRAAPRGGWAQDWERRHARLHLRVRRHTPRPAEPLLPEIAC